MKKIEFVYSQTEWQGDEGGSLELEKGGGEPQGLQQQPVDPAENAPRVCRG